MEKPLSPPPGLTWYMKCPLSLQTPAPPGPAEPHFVFADECEPYLAKYPPNADFSKVRASHSNSLTEHPLT